MRASPRAPGATATASSIARCARRCAASAIILDQQIDTGPVLARKHYPAPPLGTDIDCRYDTAIRADLLLEVLRGYHATGRLDVEIQQAGQGHSYYVIHPLLKHLALLSLPEH